MTPVVGFPFETAFAPAKVNLFLHVGPPRADGLHPIASLMVFATRADEGVGDRLTLMPDGDGLTIEGPFAGGLHADSGNLISQARAALEARAGARPGGLTLHKALPLASGLGGGSSDAAATVRLLNKAWALGLGEAELSALIAPLGSDMAACLEARPVIATGRGEILQPAPAFPDLPVVLVNPGVPSPTGAVYRAYDAGVAAEGANLPAWPQSVSTPAGMAEFIRSTRNDLEAPAVRLAPAISEALGLLAAAPETLLARMSGSGATCFALTATTAAAVSLAQRVSRRRPAWWVRACTLSGKS